MREGVKEELHKAIMATVQPEIDRLMAERDAARAECERIRAACDPEAIKREAVRELAQKIVDWPQIDCTSPDQAEAKAYYEIYEYCASIPGVETKKMPEGWEVAEIERRAAERAAEVKRRIEEARP